MKPGRSGPDPRALLFVGILLAMCGGLAVREMVGPGPRAGAVINRAEAASERGDVDGAFAALSRVAEARPENAKGWLRAGRALARTEPLRAVDPLRRAAELDSTRPRYQWELAQALARGGESREAWEALQVVLDRQPDHADALMLAAALSAAEGHVELTLGLWIAALENGASDPDRARWDPRFDPVRSDPRFLEAILAKRVPGAFVPAPVLDPAG